MDKITKRLKDYIDAHPFDPGDSDCKTVLDQLDQAYAESHETTRRRSVTVSKNWIALWSAYLWMITMPYGTSVANFAPHTNIKHLLMDYNTDSILPVS